jgi:ABC-2 type transport system ATP-binding protein
MQDNYNKSMDLPEVPAPATGVAEIITAINLKKIYHGITVLDIPSIGVGNGESFGLVGNNGAGKTTFFRLILDLIEASSGEVRINGEKVARHDEWKSKVGSFLDESFLIGFLSPEEYFSFTGKIYNKSEGDIALFLESMKEFFNGEILGSGKLIRDLSKGNQKKTGIAAALISDPQILILDEPFTALDPTSQIRLKRMLNELKTTKKTTMLISSHDLNHVTEVCDRIVVLEKGNVVKDIRTSENTLKELESYFSV